MSGAGSCDVAVAGAGPAGLAAAAEAARLGAGVVLLEQGDAPGGQLLRQTHRFFGATRCFAGRRGFDIAATLSEAAASAGVPVLVGAVVYGSFADGTLGLTWAGGNYYLQPRALIVATGAGERPARFRGWDLPGVMTAGAAQTLANVFLVRPGRRAVMVGAGNVGLIVAYQLLQAGVAVAAVVEIRPRITGYLVHAAKLLRAGVPILTGTTVTAARGERGVEAVTLAAVDGAGHPVPGSERTIAADLVCLAAGLSPENGLAAMCGCRLRCEPALGGWVPLHNAWMQTTLPGVFVAGDAAGIGEASSAIAEGQRAGIGAARAAGRGDDAAASDAARPAAAALRQLESGPLTGPRRQAKTRLRRCFNLARRGA